MPADSETTHTSPDEVVPTTGIQQEEVAPRRSTRVTSTSKSAAEEKSAKKADANADGNVEQDDNGAKKAKTTQSKKSSDDSTESLALGDTLPDIVLKNEKDEDVNVKGLEDDSAGVVLFLVAKADTPGCTTQACGFRDVYPNFEALKFKVFCLSADSPSAQTKWQTKNSLPYPLLSDPKRMFIAALTGSTAKTPRSHFIFVKGKLAEKKMPVKPVDSPRFALEFITALAKNGDAAGDAISSETVAVTDVPTDADTKTENVAEADVSGAAEI
ncbi:hypothetical protein EW145_g6016 [Phellinidium pouzarii]|uniref:thioredoxin-dependent peroxiredoxin n=1 Tax=Phellinidium pouzarii TaxID=167371 RepID=A0A4S4KZU2_9AGAM|nr:hypothetical protein EW145_g6016 [Phellinidium pouzarii]